MSIEITAEVLGITELTNALQGFSQKVAKNALNSALSAGALPIMKEAKRHAAKAPEPHEMEYGKSGNKVEVMPGLLKESIRRRRLKVAELRQLNATAGVAVYIGKGTKQKLYPKYWNFVEFGTSKMPAHPFLRPAFDSQSGNALARFKQKLAENVEKIKAETGV